MGGFDWDVAPNGLGGLAAGKLGVRLPLHSRIFFDQDWLPSWELTYPGISLTVWHF